MIADDARLDALVAAAADARERAYAPYSRFKVGAAVLTESGRVHVGVNVENASYPCGMCAEQSAVSAAVTSGDRGIDAVAVVTDAVEPAAPCGICRQTLYEFNPGMTVVLANTAGARRVHRLSDLMPHGFGPRDLIGT